MLKRGISLHLWTILTVLPTQSGSIGRSKTNCTGVWMLLLTRMLQRRKKIILLWIWMSYAKLRWVFAKNRHGQPGQSPEKTFPRFPQFWGVPDYPVRIILNAVALELLKIVKSNRTFSWKNFCSGSSWKLRAVLEGSGRRRAHWARPAGGGASLVGRMSGGLV